MTAHPLTLPELIARLSNTATLLAQHRDDGHGRCVTCSGAGGAAGGARVTWPCDLYLTVAQADQLQVKGI